MTRESLSGRKLGNYTIGPLVGSGGMGEVYRGRDTTLNRDVAIKVLLPAVVADHERLARFNREAQVLASLNHPNIAQIHGVEQSDAGPLLVLEYVGGPTLADRIAQGPLPIDEALAIARQIADALEAAHERGVIHRDLKPANIKVDDHGTVKVLDFGLAKALEHGSGIGGQGSGTLVANSPTITTPAMTQAGLILGTAAYMSPEQAKGRVVDKRSDLWAFGCVLYEMLSGRRAFEGEDVTDTIAAVVRGEPNWALLPADVPPQILLLLKRCLEKDRRARISDVGVARFLMNERIEGAAAPAMVPGRSRRGPAVAVAALLLGAVIGAGAWSWAPRRAPELARTVRFSYVAPPEQPLMLQGNDHDVAMAPDGSFVIYRSRDRNSMQSFLVVRHMDDAETQVLGGTASARFPFLSPDGQWVAFFFGAEMRKVPLAGGSAEIICRVTSTPRGASWGENGIIVFATNDGGDLYQVPATGGAPTVVPMTQHVDGEAVGLPQVLPGGKTVLFTSFNRGMASAAVEALDLASGNRKKLVSGATDGAYVQSGHLVYATLDKPDDLRLARMVLRAVRFDATHVEISGEPQTVIESAMMGTTGSANYALSLRGDLAFVPAGASSALAQGQRELVWVDRKGVETPLGAPPRAYAVARISPDGTRVALDIRDQTNDIWTFDLGRRTLSLLNRDIAQDMSPLWTPDARRILWTSTRGGGNPNIFSQAADGSGTPERLTTNDGNQFPTSIAADGKTIVMFGAVGTQMDIFTVNFDEPGRQQRPLLTHPSGLEFGGELSPDGKWIAYHSNETGQFEVYVRPYPNVSDGRWQISSSGGSRAAWSRDGRELFYLDSDGLLTAVAVRSTATFSAGVPERLLKTAYYLGSTMLGLDLRAYDVSADARRFLMIKNGGDQSRSAEMPASMTIVINWATELEKRLPAIP